MKKFVSLISVLLCAVLLSTTVFAASVEPDAYTLYQKCVKKMKTLSSVELSGKEKGVFSGDFEYTSTCNVKAKVLISDGKLFQFEKKQIYL